jgi:hypothetical protein
MEGLSVPLERFQAKVESGPREENALFCRVTRVPPISIGNLPKHNLSKRNPPQLVCFPANPVCHLFPKRGGRFCITMRRRETAGLKL